MSSPLPHRTSEEGEVGPLALGYAALERGELEAAKTLFAHAVEEDRTPEALEALGMVASLVIDLDTVFEAREGAYELYLKRGDRESAGRIAVLLAVDHGSLRGEIALANGWLGRARTMLEGLAETAAHASLYAVEGLAALMVDNDAEKTLLCTDKALRVARQVGEPSLEAYALSVEGLALVTAGRVAEGVGKLDEAAIACIAGEVKDPYVISAVLCSMMDACDRSRDWERAREWFGHVSSFAARWKNRQFHAQCRPHYAAVLTWRGAWEEAERELLTCIADLTAVSPPMAVEGTVRLAELRLRQGRWEEAERLFEQVRHEPIAQIGQAELALCRGDAAVALQFAERALRRVAKNDRLERMPALESYIRICLANNQIERARAALPELDEMLGSAPTRPVRAAVRLSRGLVSAADGDLEAACSDLEDAIDLFEASEAPFEASRARIELAPVLTRLGRQVEAVRVATVAAERLEALGAVQEAQRARALLQGGESAAVPEDRPRGLSERELEVLRLLARGMSNQEIAEVLVLSVRTVQRHVDNIYTKIGIRGRAAAGAFAATHHIV